MKRQHNAFTLIELMVVVAIIALLAMLGVPRFSHYFTKAYHAEVTTMLASLHTAQQAHKATHGSYSTILWGKDGIGWKPEGQFYYTYGFNVPDAQEGVHYFKGKLETPVHALGVTHADNTSFIAKAAGSPNKTRQSDVWQVSESRKIAQI